SSNVPSRMPSSNNTAPRNHIFVYGEWRQPSVLYNIIFGTSAPSPVITERFTYIHATLSDNPRQSALSGHRGATIEGSYVTGLTEAEIERMDRYHEDCTRQEVFVQFICRHGKNCTRKAYVWVPRLQAPDVGIQTWDAAGPSRPDGGADGGANGGANGALHGFNFGASQGAGGSGMFGGAAFAA
ncbi:hypothetical protein LX36DRAFT_531042, partial [Colletotrichum falcatum]